MGTPVTQNDLDSVKDVPIEEALAYLEGLERERRGLLKAGQVLRAVPGPTQLSLAVTPVHREYTSPGGLLSFSVESLL